MIDNKDISVVVQGAVDCKLTPLCLASIRRKLPNSKIILSTWNGSNVSGLDYDVLVLSDDPGCEICDVEYNVKNNINRQIVSSINGLKMVKTRFAMKIRSDMEVIHGGFIKAWGKFDDYRNDDLQIFQNRIIVNNFYCANPVITNFPYHISDWVQFGLTVDLVNFWGIPLQDKLEMGKYYLQFEKPSGDRNGTWLFRYIPEQYISKAIIEKNGYNTYFNYYGDLNEKSLQQTELFFANNFVILDYRKYGIRFLKFNPYKWGIENQMNYVMWVDLYIKYCNNMYRQQLHVLISRSFGIEQYMQKLYKHGRRMFGGLKIFCSSCGSILYYVCRTIIRVCTIGKI